MYFRRIIGNNPRWRIVIALLRLGVSLISHDHACASDFYNAFRLHMRDLRVNGITRRD